MNIPDLTIVVPVHERQWPLDRCLRYLERFEGPVIVADSSSEPYSNASRFPRVDYRHLPGVPYYQKLKMTYSSVQTEFLVDIPDDDFVLLSGLEDCCNHLKANPDVLVCGGHILVFEDVGSRPALELTHTGANLATHVEVTNTGTDRYITDKRLERLFANPFEIVHAVMRRSAALAPHEIIEGCPELQPIRFWARLWLFAVAAIGPISHLDTVLLLRAKDERLINGADYPKNLERDVAPRQLIHRLDKDGGILTEYLLKHTEFSVSEARNVVQNTLRHIANPMTAKGFDKAKQATIPLAEAAVKRQIHDITRAMTLATRCPKDPASSSGLS